MAGSPVVVVGLDAMEMSIAHDLIGQGRMPNLGRFLDTSTWGLLQHAPGLVVGSVWPTLAAGCDPSYHGFYCDLEIEPGTYESQRWGPWRIEVPRVWDVLSDAGKRCAVLDVPITQPSEQLNGVQICEWGAHDRFVPLSGAPATFVDDVVREFGEYPVQPKCDPYNEDGDLDGLEKGLRAGVLAKERLTAAYLDGGEWDLVWSVFGESHCAGHHFYNARQGALLDIYEQLDASLGRLLGRIPPSTTVMVMLSHGIGNHYDGDHLLHEILRRLDVANGGERRWITWREKAIRLAGRRGVEARQAKPLFGERRYFKVHNNELYGGIRVNLKGREPRGRVAPGRECNEILADLRRDFLELENPETGEPLVLDVWFADDLYDGPRRDRLPDAFVVWNRKAPIRGARSPKIGTIEAVTRSVRTGDHRPTGVVAVRGTGTPTGRIDGFIRSIDVAPTIAALCGVEMPGIPGRPIDAFVVPERAG